MHSQQQQQQLRQGVHDWPHRMGAYNLGIEMGQHVNDIIAIYWRHRYIISRFRVRQLRVIVLVS